MFFRKKISVLPGYKALLYQANIFVRELEPGVHYVADKDDIWAPHIFMLERTTTVTNQEVLTSDNIALRFSFFITYKVQDTQKLRENFDVSKGRDVITASMDEFLHRQAQLIFRDAIGACMAEEMNTKREELGKKSFEAVQNLAAEKGIFLKALQIRDITFPKPIQDVFALQLQAKIRSKTDLENARTQVAAARALKNAADLMKGDENIRFLQWLEVMNQLAKKSGNTFVIGNPQEWGQPTK